jgi:4-amino-4-deoxy-L-arabinose transferase-like glycosyltransferase
MNMSTRPPAWLVLLLAVLAFSFQGTRGLWEPDEGRYASAGVNMERSGDWLVPSIDAEHPHLTKPPVVYWALASSFTLLGENEWAARLPAALAYVGTGLLMFGLGRRFCAAKPWLPALAWGLSFATLMGSNIVSTDALLMLFETAAMFTFVEAWAGPPERRRTWMRLMWLAWALAFMTKGPPGMLPLLAMAAFLGVHQRARLKELFDPVGLLIFATVGFVWFAVVIVQDPGRLQYFLGYEVYDRVFTATHNRNSAWYGGLTVYLPALIAGALPWWIVGLIAAGGPRAAGSTLMDRVRHRDPQWLLLLYWFLLPLAIFMLARSRLPLYVLPLFAPLALMIARPLANWAWLNDQRLRVLVVVTAVALVALKGYVAKFHTDRDSRAMAAAIQRVVDPESIDGITFVDMRPFYGLNFYLGRPVKGVPLESGKGKSSAFAPGEDLCSELARNRRTLFALKENRAERFRDGVVRCGAAAPTEAGHFKADGNRILLMVVPR